MAADATVHPALTAPTLAAVGRLSRLTSLDLSRRAAPPGALRDLVGGLPRLETLTLHGAALKAEEVQEVEKAFPAVNVLKRHLAIETAPDLATLVGSLSMT
jgi:hypothetical protein